MERPVNSKVRHGMPSCARYGCKRPECVAAFGRARRQSEEDARNGVKSIVPSDEAAEHLDLLVNAGMSPADIAARSGVDAKVVLEVRKRQRPQIYRTTAEALTGIPIPEGGWTPVVADGVANAVGARRRLQALSLQGFSMPFVASETGVYVSTIFKVRSGERPRVLISSMRAIAEAHDRLWDADPLSMGFSPTDVKRVRTLAQEHGWVPTEAWADIDDPDCVPILNTPRYVALTDDAQELIDKQGYTRAAAAERLGVTLNTLNSAFAYRNRKALASA